MSVSIPGGVLRTNLRRVSALSWKRDELPIYGDFNVSATHPLVNGGASPFYAIDYNLLEIENDDDIAQQSGLKLKITLGARYRWPDTLNTSQKTYIFNRFSSSNGGYFSSSTRYPDRTKVTRLDSQNVEIDYTPQVKTTLGASSNAGLPTSCSPFYAYMQCVFDTETDDWAAELKCSNAPMWSAGDYFSKASLVQEFGSPRQYDFAEWQKGYISNRFGLQKLRCGRFDNAPLEGQTSKLTTINGIVAAEFTDTDGTYASMVAGLAADFNTKRSAGLVCNQHAFAYPDPSDNEVFVIEGHGNNPNFNVEPFGGIPIWTDLGYDTTIAAGTEDRVQAWDSNITVSHLAGSPSEFATFANAFTEDPCDRNIDPLTCQFGTTSDIRVISSSPYTYQAGPITTGTQYIRLTSTAASDTWAANGYSVYHKQVRQTPFWGVTS